MLTGVELSAWHHSDRDHPQISFEQIKEEGHSFVVIKATQGNTWQNPHYLQDAGLASRAGLLVGALHYAEPGQAMTDDVNSDAKAQALYCRQAISNSPCALGVACELAELGSYPAYQLPEWYGSFASYIAESDYRTMIRLSPAFLELLPGAPWSSRLWLSEELSAEYPGREQVRPFLVTADPQEVRGVVGAADVLRLLVPRAVNPYVANDTPVTTPEKKVPRDNLKNGGGGV